MYNMKIVVKDYGLLIRSGKDWEVPMDLSDYGDDKVLMLTKKSTLRGIVNQLIGRRCSIYEDRGKSEFRLDEQLTQLCSQLLIQITKRPRIESVFLRPTDPKQLPQVNLGDISWDESYPLIYRLKNELTEASGNSSLSGVHEHFLNESAKFGKIVKSLDWNNKASVDDFLESYLPLANFDSFQEGKLGKAIQKYTNEVTTFIETCIENQSVSGKIPYYSITHKKLVNSIAKRADEEEEFRESLLDPKSKEAKWSCFTSSLKQARHWKNDKKVNFYSRGAPGLLAKSSFNIWIEDIPESILDMCYEAPKIVPAGEGGIAILGITREQPPLFESDELFVELKDLRRAGLKIKKQEWEKADDSKSSKA